ncbi:MAG: FapA family protein [Roseburia sp.]|nr:FapA family protein [Roseburia sp.]
MGFFRQTGNRKEEKPQKKHRFLSPDGFYHADKAVEVPDDPELDKMLKHTGANDTFLQGSSDYLLHITEDCTEALITLYYRPDSPFTEEEIRGILEEHGIVTGVLEETLAELVAGGHDYEEVLIAKGTAPIDGRDGFFEFHFNPQPETRPIILADGTVDYNVLGKIELVVEEQHIVTYHPAMPGKDGEDVYGQKLEAYQGVDLPPLQCKHCWMDDEGNKYYAKVEGNVTLEENVLTVTPLYLVEGNLDAATGDVDFHGDVVVQGNVFAGVTVRTTGNITINGHVETANLYAGKDVILKNGMQGAGAGVIRAKRNVMAKFLEQTQVYAGNEINTGALLNCDVESNNSIVVTGKRGTIIGGRTMAAELISAASLGNRAGVTTQLTIGLEKDFKTLMEELDSLTVENQNELSDILRELDELSVRLKSQSATPELSSRKLELTRAKIQCQTRLSELYNKREQIIDINSRSVEGKIVISELAYTGAEVTINGIHISLHSEYRNVTFKKHQREIRIVSNKL